MIGLPPLPFLAALSVALLMMSAAMVLAMLRLLRGPTLPDRVVALDLLATISVGMILTYTLVTGVEVVLDVAIVISLIAYISTIAFASYVARGRLG